MVGEEEIANKTVRVKPLRSGEQSTGDEVERSKMIGFVKGLLQDLES
jgi:histidyl-tRNA synthetase